jgi:hypothetical protein
MADNSGNTVYRIKQWCKSVHSIDYFYFIKKFSVASQSSRLCGRRGGPDYLGIWITERETPWCREHTHTHTQIT